MKLKTDSLRNILPTLAFYAAHGGLHSFSKTDGRTKKAVAALAARGYLKVNWPTCQAEFTGKIFA